jgi:hypothetical protein
MPTLEHLNALRQADDEAVVITLRGIGEMTPGKPDSFVEPAKSLSDWENGRPRALRREWRFQPAGRESSQTQAARKIWKAMDEFTDRVALIFAKRRALRNHHGVRRARAGAPNPMLTGVALARRTVTLLRGCTAGPAT